MFFTTCRPRSDTDEPGDGRFRAGLRHGGLRAGEPVRRYRIDDFQGVYFVLDNLTHLLDLARIDFEPIYRQVAGLLALAPSELAPGEQFIWQGTGAAHRSRGAP